MLVALDVIGIFVFALSGATLAIRKQLDVVGAVSLAIATGLAGGIARDVLLGDSPPLAFREPWYLMIPLVASVAAIAVPALPRVLHRPVIIFDATGLALFAVVGASKAVDADVGLLAAMFIGTLAATGGGALRDVLVNEVPTIFTPESGLYVIPAALGSLAIAVAAENDLDSPLSAFPWPPWCSSSDWRRFSSVGVHPAWAHPGTELGSPEIPSRFTASSQVRRRRSTHEIATRGAS